MLTEGVVVFRNPERIFLWELRYTKDTLNEGFFTGGVCMKVTALLGTYRKGGIIDQAVDEILAAASASGAETEKIYLIDRHIAYCKNCRTCTQVESGQRGICPTQDDMSGLLDTLAASDALVLASPVNFGTVTAVMKCFIERLVCFAYWPWGQPAPKERGGRKEKQAILVVSSAAPAIMTRFGTRIAGLLKQAAGILGAHTAGVLYIGLAAQAQSPELHPRQRNKARRLGRKLAVKKQ